MYSTVFIKNFRVSVDPCSTNPCCSSINCSIKVSSLWNGNNNGADLRDCEDEKTKKMMLLNIMSDTYQVLHVNAHPFYLDTQNSIIYSSRHKGLWNEFGLLFMLDLPNSDTLQKKGDREGHADLSLPCSRGMSPSCSYSLQPHFLL